MTEIDQIHRNPLSALGGAAWHWEIAVYLFLGGMTAGLMILSVLLDRRVPAEQRSRWSRLLPFAAPVLLSVGMLALFIDLEYRTHAYRFYLAFEWTSPMSWGSWILLAIYPVTLLYAFGQMSHDDCEWLATRKPLARTGLGKLVRWTRRAAFRKPLGLRWANIVLGIALGGYTGVLLSTLAARAAWNTTILAPLFLVSGLSTGAALMMLFPLHEAEHTLLRRWDLGAIATELTLLLLLLIGLATGNAEARGAARLLLGGELTALFWALVVIAGLVVPLLIETIEARKHLRPTILAPALLLVGGFALRWILLIAGQTHIA